MGNITLYRNAKDVVGQEFDIDLFLEDIKNGQWQNNIIDYRSGKAPKESLPAVTLSGRFSKRNANSLVKASGYIGIDIDDLGSQIEDTIDKLKQDAFVFAVWKSVSGAGLAVLFKIDPRHHLRAFEGISEYLYNTYEIIIDQACKDICRLRFVSHDPDIYINHASAKFTLYPKPKPRALQRLPRTIFVQNDFDEIIREITSRRIDLVDNYHMWIAVAFGLIDTFGENARDYFHAISQNSPKYKAEKCDKQFDACLRQRGTGVTIATFYWLCKQAGIETISQKTKTIATAASHAKKGGRNIESVIDLLKDVENIDEKDSKSIVQQVFENNIDFKSEDGFIYELETWLKQNYEIKLNEISRKLEMHEKELNERHLNTMYLQGKKIFDNKLNYDLFKRLIFSEFTPSYNPLLDFIEQNKDRNTNGKAINNLCNSIISTMDRKYIEVFITKWLVGIIESIHGDICSLWLVLVGGQNTGKTEWFRRLLPDQLKNFYAESKLDKEKDDPILMTQRLLIMNDEMGGNTINDPARLNNLTSARVFTLREPYGQFNVDLKRIAVLGGTTNNEELISDSTGNRRIIPIRVIDIDKELYNSINKYDLLIEAYWLWKNEKVSSDLTKDEIEFLNKNTTDFQEVSIEAELLLKWYKIEGDSFVTTTDIKSFLEHTSGQKLNIRKLGLELRRLGFKQVSKRIDELPRKGYLLGETAKIDKNNWTPFNREPMEAPVLNNTQKDDELPF